MAMFFVLIAALAGFTYGVAHGIGPDHLAALASLLAREGGGWRRAASVGLRFGAAHALILGGLAVPAALSGAMIAPAWERAAELTGGVLLIVLGATALRSSSRAAPHAHPHRHAGPALVGGLFALSGVRSLAIALPPLLVAERSLWAAAVYVAAFGAGVTAVMVAFGLAVGAGATRVSRAGLGLASGAIAIALGIWWVGSSL
jgi:hypothetical protein